VGFIGLNFQSAKIRKKIGLQALPQKNMCVVAAAIHIIIYNISIHSTI